MSRAREIADLGSPAASGLSNRNLIINGAMTVAQRGTSFTSISGVTYSVDRFFVQDVNSAAGEATVSQSTTAPDDFINSLKIDVTTADTSLVAADQYKIEHRIEGQNISHLNWGTSAAKTVTMSFWIRSNKTGNTQVALLNSANDRAYVATFTINTTDTWEKKELTVAGETSGTWLTTNGVGLRLRWGSFGSTYQTSSIDQWVSSEKMSRDDSPINFFDNTANELYITGVQLEVGDTATPFEHEDFGTTLAKCQRYYYYSGFGFNNPGGTDSGSTDYEGQIFSVHIGSNRHTFFGSFPVFLRGLPTLTFYSPHDGASANAENYTGGGNISISASYSRSRQGLGGYSQTSTSGDTLRAYVEANAEL
jgi:hypothetical protein